MTIGGYCRWRASLKTSIILVAAAQTARTIGWQADRLRTFRPCRSYRLPFVVESALCHSLADCCVVVRSSRG